MVMVEQEWETISVGTVNFRRTVWLLVGRRRPVWLSVGRRRTVWLFVGRRRTVWLLVGRRRTVWLLVGHRNFWKTCVIMDPRTREVDYSKSYLRYQLDIVDIPQICHCAY